MYVLATSITKWVEINVEEAIKFFCTCSFPKYVYINQYKIQ